MILRNPDKIKEQAASHEDPTNPGSYKKVLFTLADFPGKVLPQMVNWARIPPKKSFRLHLHQDMYEIFILTKGSILMGVNSEEKILKKGDSVLVPPGEYHKMTNSGPEEVEYYVIGFSLGTGGKTIIKE